MPTKGKYPMAVQTALDEERIRRGHSYAFLSHSLGFGSPTHLAYVLQGRCYPQVDTLCRIAEFYDYDITLTKKETR